MKENNSQILKQLQGLAVISGSQTQIIRRSLEKIGAKDAYIRDLQTAMAQEDSLNPVLVMSPKGVLGDLDNQDVYIKVLKAIICIDISDKLLFKNGS
jgi:chemotaxis protein MotB